MPNTEMFDADVFVPLEKHARDVTRAINLLDDEQGRTDMVDDLNTRAVRDGIIGRHALLQSDLIMTYEQTINHRTNGFNTSPVSKQLKPVEYRGVFVGFESWKVGEKRALMYRLEGATEQSGVFVSAFAPVEGSKLNLYKNGDEMRSRLYKANVDNLAAAMNYLSDFNDSDEYQEALAEFSEFFAEIIEGEPDGPEIATLGIGVEQLWRQANVSDDDTAMTHTMRLISGLVRPENVYSIRGHELMEGVDEDGRPIITKGYNTTMVHQYKINGLGTMLDYIPDIPIDQQVLIPVYTAVNENGERCRLPLKYIIEFRDLGRG